MNPFRSIIHYLGNWYIERLCLSEAQNQEFSHLNERSIEYRFALQALGDARPTTVLDVGTGTTAWPHLLRNCGYAVTAIDNVSDYWPNGMLNRHWTVLDVDITNPNHKLQGTFDSITCISVIEHIEDHVLAMQTMVGLLADEGILVLTTPYSHSNPYPNVYTHPQAIYGKSLPYICRSSSKGELHQWLAGGLTLERRELWRLFTGPVWATGQRCHWEQVEAEDTAHQLGCFLFRKR